MKRIIEITDNNNAQEIVSWQSKPMRCDRCKWWNIGFYSKSICNSDRMANMIDKTIATDLDFYCKFWEGKED
jgi:hypothetical protein